MTEGDNQNPGDTGLIKPDDTTSSEDIKSRDVISPKDIKSSGETSPKDAKPDMSISARSFVTALIIIFALMVFTYILTFIIPSGEYSRLVNENNEVVIDTAAGFRYVPGGISFIKWILSPFLVLTVEGSGSIIAIIIFLLVIGGVFAALEKCGLIRYMLDKISFKYSDKKYMLLGVVSLFFMLMGSFVGTFEECVPMVPIVVALSLSLGWDALTGMGMSLLSVGCGFAAGVANPFTVGVAQRLSGLVVLSGMWYRLIAFVLIYLLLLSFLMMHAKKVDSMPSKDLKTLEFTRDGVKDKAMIWFCIIIGSGVVAVALSSIITALQDYTMIIVALMFLVAGIACPMICRMNKGEFLTVFGKGMIGILPAALMILMASSIRYILTEAKILDTIMYGIIKLTDTVPRSMVILFIYLLVLIMNFFIASGSAKAFLLIPLIAPVAGVFGIPLQLCIMAFAFGDGFSNVFYPTNPVLLISLKLADVEYGKWAKWTVKFQIANIILTSLILLVGLSIGYK